MSTRKHHSSDAARPATPAAARRCLQKGNAGFVQLLAQQAGASDEKFPLLWERAGSFGVGTPPKQAPFAAILGCADARVPLEIIFQQACNDLFVVRVAGNVLSSEALGSLDFAATAFAQSLRLLAVLGHSQCGAVTAAVDAFLAPTEYLDLAPGRPLRAILDRLFIAVRAADRSLREVHGAEVARSKGYRAALVECSVVVNAALTAWALARELGPARRSEREVMFGVYDLATHEVWSPAEDSSGQVGVRTGLARPPRTPSAFRAFGLCAARLPVVTALLK